MMNADIPSITDRTNSDADDFMTEDKKRLSAQQNPVVFSVQGILDTLAGLRIRFEAGETLSQSQVREILKEKLDEMENMLVRFPQLHSRKQTIKYVIVALVDEVMIFSNWPYAKNWQQNPLELEVFGRSIAGENFFSLLENEGYKDPELAELFFICLCFGFNRNDRQYRDYKQRLYALIPQRMPEDERRLSPGAEDTIGGRENTLPPLIGHTALIIAIFVSTLCYWIASQWLWHDAADYFHYVSNL